jgi:undecaprenyl-diphosphatase
MNDLLKAAVLGVVEGVTEFLPISSTGHLIIVNDFIGFGGDFANSFKILIQLGAVLAVVVYFRRRLFPFGAGASSSERKAAWDVWMKSGVALVPAVVIGTMAGEYVEAKLFNQIVVSAALIAGGIVLVAVDRRASAPSARSGTARHSSSVSSSASPWCPAFRARRPP